MAKEFIFVFVITTLPNLLPAQIIEDLSNVDKLSVTEIRRVMPEHDELKDVKNYATQVTIEDCKLGEGDFSFTFTAINSEHDSESTEKNVSLSNNSTVRIIFDTTILDQATKLLLIAKSDDDPVGAWEGSFNLTDIKARVAVVADYYLRVTTGELNIVTIEGKDKLLSCENTSSPCYFSKESFKQFPPVIDRCVDLTSGEDSLTYCDATVTELLPLPDEPTLILLDEEMLNLRYPTTNNTYEVLMIEDSPLEDKNIFKCSNSEIPNDRCHVNISTTETNITFIIITVEESDFVEGSSAEVFNVIPVKVMHLTEDSVMATWETDLEPEFDVFIKTKSNLDDFEYKLNSTCLATSATGNRFESIFINVTKDENHIAVIQQGNKAVAKTIKGEPIEQSEIYRLSKTEGEAYDLTFMFQNNNSLSTVKLIEVNVLDDPIVENQFYDGTFGNNSLGYWFKSTEVHGIFNSERKFYLVGYNESGIPIRCGVAYITFVDVEVELDLVGSKGSIVRAHVFDNKNLTVGDKTCDANSTCYTEANDGNDFITICTVIENAAPSKGYLDQCEDMKLSTPSELEDDVRLLLLDSSRLYLSYDTNTSFEVLALDIDGHMLSWNQNFTCVENDGGCHVDIILPEGSEMVDFAIISVYQNGSLMKSMDYPFKNVPLDALYLTDDAVITSWTSENKNLSASIRIMPNLYHDKYSSDRICESTSCEYFFILPETQDYVAAISDGDNTVAKTVTKDPPIEKRVVKNISRTADTYMTVFSVEGKTSSPFKVKLIEVSISEEVVTNILYEGDITEESSNFYKFATHDDIIESEEPKKLLVVEYSDGDGQITGVGAVYVTFVDYDFELYKVLDGSSILRGLVYGNRNVTVGNKVCTLGSPCYMEVSATKYIPICTVIDNSAFSGSYLDQCEDRNPQVPEELNEDVPLLLLDSSSLYLSYDANTLFEVLALDIDGHMLSWNQNFTCVENDGGCHLDVILPEGSGMVDFAIISVYQNGSLMKSMDHPFKNVPLDARYLTDDAVITSWTSENKNLSASIRILSDLYHDKYSSDPICESTSCEYFFILPDTQDYVAAISDGNNTVAKTVTKDLSPQLEILQISRTVDGQNNSTAFMFRTNSKPISINLIEITEAGGIISNLEGSGEVSSVEDDYQFKFLRDIGSLEEKRNFLLVEYSADKQVRKAGAAYVENKFHVELEWISNSKILRESVYDNKNVLVGDEYCNKSVIACYHSAFPDFVENVPLCTETMNFANGAKNNILVCEDQKPKNTEELTVNKLQLQEDVGNISLSAPCIKNSAYVGLALYSSGNPLDMTEIECLKEDIDTCSAESLYLSKSSAHLDVVVICISENNVTSSSIVPVEDLKITTKKLGETSMLVHWTVANAHDYVAVLESEENMPARLGKELTSEITCDDQDSCYSTFFDIDLKLNYHLIIHKQGDNISFTEKHIDPLNNDEEPAPFLITKVSRVHDNETKVFLDEGFRNEEVTVLVKIFDGTSIDISGKGIPVDFSNQVFMFIHSETIFDKEHVTFSVLVAEEDTLCHTGVADVALCRFNTDVAWVGAKRNTKGASLRVNVGNQDKVELGDLTCEKENSPCYFFEVESSALPEVLERCVLLGNSVMQCDEEVTPFKAMDKNDLNITFDDNVLEVLAPLSESNSHIELKIYDPSSPEINISKGAVNCTGSVLENTEVFVCRQPVQLSHSQMDIKVIVTEVNVEGKTRKSVVIDFKGPSFGVESWVIAVSVLSALVFAATGSYFIVVLLKKKKLQRWESDAIKKEVKKIGTQGASDSDQDPQVSSRPCRDSISDSSVSLPGSSGSNVSLPKRQTSSERSPPFRGLDNFSERPFSREVSRFPVKSNVGYPVERVSHIMKSQSPPEIYNKRRPVNYLKPQTPLGRNNEAFVSSESDAMTNSRVMLPKINLASRVNLSALQGRLSQYQQTRV